LFFEKIEKNSTKNEKIRKNRKHFKNIKIASAYNSEQKLLSKESYPLGRVAKALGLYKLLAVRFPAKTECFCSFKKN
jgi:hypothetical protein